MAPTRPADRLPHHPTPDSNVRPSRRQYVQLSDAPVPPPRRAYAPQYAQFVEDEFGAPASNPVPQNRYAFGANAPGGEAWNPGAPYVSAPQLPRQHRAGREEELFFEHTSFTPQAPAQPERTHQPMPRTQKPKRRPPPLQLHDQDIEMQPPRRQRTATRDLPDTREHNAPVDEESLAPTRSQAPAGARRMAAGGVGAVAGGLIPVISAAATANVNGYGNDGFKFLINDGVTVGAIVTGVLVGGGLGYGALSNIGQANKVAMLSGAAIGLLAAAINAGMHPDDMFAAMVINFIAGGTSIGLLAVTFLTMKYAMPFVAAKREQATQRAEEQAAAADEARRARALKRAARDARTDGAPRQPKRTHTDEESVSEPSSRRAGATRNADASRRSGRQNAMDTESQTSRHERTHGAVATTRPARRDKSVDAEGQSSRRERVRTDAPARPARSDEARANVSRTERAERANVAPQRSQRAQQTRPVPAPRPRPYAAYTQQHWDDASTPLDIDGRYLRR